MSEKNVSKDRSRMYTRGVPGRGYELYRLEPDLDYYAYVKNVTTKRDAEAWLKGDPAGGDEEE